MRTSTLFLILLMCAAPCAAQSDSTWTTEAQGRVSFNQVGFYRWHDGGISSLALGAGVSGEAQKTATASQHQHEVRLAFGVVRQNSIDLRKSEDIIHLRSTFKFSRVPIFGQSNLAITLDLRSQFADGFRYNEKKSGVEALRISGFFSPAILTQTVGLDYQANSWVNLRFGVAAKQTVVTIRALRERYKVSPDALLRWQVGMAGLVIVERTVFTNVHLKSTLTFFVAFNQPSPDTIWETLVTMKVNSWLQVNAEYTALFDKDLSPYIQQKQALTVGVSFRIL
ncbi:MAG: DUF3078 domain-containing protein [Bacteroidetes bacterium]|nr:DUF3078 domain-containing protein [Bacteroidota bacterium]